MVDRKLGNPDFMARAPEEVVEENRERKAAAEARKLKIARGAGAAVAEPLTEEPRSGVSKDGSEARRKHPLDDGGLKPAAHGEGWWRRARLHPVTTASSN